MSVFHVTFKNTMLDALSISAMRIHDGDPGSAGTANQVLESDDTTIAQTACTFAAASGGEAALSENVEFTDLHGSQNVTWFSVWTAGNDFVGKGEIVGGDTSANASGEFTITTQTKLQLLDPA